MQARERAERLHERATKAVKMNKWSEKELVVVFGELDTFGGFRYFGAKNLYEYAMSVHKLSESVALNIINVARKANQVPAIGKAVVDGTISISAARKIVPVITKETASAWIDLAATQSVRNVEKAVAAVKPELAVKETARFVQEDRLAVVLSMSERDFAKLKRVMDLEAQRSRVGVSQGTAVSTALDVYLEKHDPVRKAERSRVREGQKTTPQSQAPVTNSPTEQTENDSHGAKPAGCNALAPVTGQTIAVRGPRRGIGRMRINSVLRHAIDLRDRRQCTHVDRNGVRCEQRRWLDVHHLVPVSLGGSNSLENLVTLCSGHHRLEHKHESFDLPYKV